MQARPWPLLALLTALASPSCALGATTQQPGVLHYQIAATIAPGTGELTADVLISLPATPAASERAFILGKRFALVPIEPPAHTEIHIEPTDKPIADLQRIRVHFDRALKRPTPLRFRYRGSVRASDDQDRLGYTPDAIEMAVELMWLPFPAELNERFTLDAQLRGVPAALVVVAQGEVVHEGDRVRIRRSTPDLDFAWTAVRGLQAVVAPGMEFYARDLQDPLVVVLRKHALAAAEFYQKWFGPLPDGPIRLAVVPRKLAGAYARIGYTVVSEGRLPGEPAPPFNEIDRATAIAHEFAHAWWSAADPLTEDYWLAESLAQYSALRYIETAFGRAPLDAAIAKARATSRNIGPLLGNGRASRAALYQKGPLLLLDLESRIGRSRLDRLLAVLSRHPPRRTQAFLDALREVAGDAAARDFEQMLRAP